MKVLWITNILFPEAESLLCQTKKECCGSGGWLLGATDGLLSRGINLVVASVSPKVKSLTRLKGKSFVYYVLPCRNERHYHKSFEGMWRDVVRRERPDFAHIHGTEFAHGLAFLNAETGLKSILSVQGIMAAIGEKYSCGLSLAEIYSNLSLFDALYSGSILCKQRRIVRYANRIEKAYFQKADIIVGRTSFDRVYVLKANPEADYRICNESLRSPFYDRSKWTYSKCNPRSIFLSQASYPLKGLHWVIKAVAAIVEKYPDVKVRIAGRDITNIHGLKQHLIQSSYSKLISKMLRKYKVKENFVFLGPLTAREMKEEYLSANVFICPSSVENSPNSIGEAQIMGVPVIASRVGGIPDMMHPSDEWMYTYNDEHALAVLIDRVFSEGYANSDTMLDIANNRHDREINLSALLDIYQSMSCNNEK